MKIYIASSWKNQHAVEMLTQLLRERSHEVFSFVENNHGEQAGHLATENGKPVEFEQWVWSDRGTRSFEYDTKGATTTDLVIYIGPSGCDAWAEVGAAWAKGVKIYGLIAKGEQVGLMRRMMAAWCESYGQLLSYVSDLQVLQNQKIVASEDEPLIQECIEIIRGEQRASVALLQRRLHLGYSRAARIMDELENRGIVGPSNGAEPRDILIDLPTK